MSEQKPCRRYGCTERYSDGRCKACARRHAVEYTRRQGRAPVEIDDQAIARFWSKVERTDGCWLWRGKTLPSGYGRFRVKGREFYAHGFAYELLVGPIPEGLELDHTCRVRNCVRPGHLEPVTHRVNIRRSRSVFGERARQTHCHRGHLFDEVNTYMHPNGNRRCLACDRERQARRRAREGRVA